MSSEMGMAGKQLQKHELLHEVQMKQVLSAQLDAFRLLDTIQTQAVERILELMQPNIVKATSELRTVSHRFKLAQVDNPVLIDELTRLMVKKFIVARAPEIAEIIKGNLPIQTHFRRIDALFSDFRPIIEGVLRGDNKLHASLPQPQEPKPGEKPDPKKEFEAMVQSHMLKRFEELEEAHFLNMCAQKQLTTRRMTKEDVPRVKRLYGDYQIDGPSLLRMILEDKGGKTFLNNFEDEHGEGPMFRRMLYETADIEAHGMLDKRVQETMLAYIMDSPLDPDEAAAISAFTIAPADPKSDKPYYDRESKFMTGGMSGGDITFPDEIVRRAIEESLLVTGENARLVIFAGRAPGLGTKIHADGIADLPRAGVGPDFDMLCYIMQSLDLVRGKKAFQAHAGQNRASLGALIKSGWNLTGINDRNKDAAYKQFMIKVKNYVIRVGARATWAHLRGKYANIKEASEAAATNLSVQRAGSSSVNSEPLPSSDVNEMEPPSVDAS